MTVWRERLWTWIQSLGFMVFVIIVGSGMALLFAPLVCRIGSMQREVRRLDTEIARQEAVEKKQKTEMEALKTDITSVERAARNKLNLARPDEMIFRFEPPPSLPLPPVRSGH